MPEGLGNFEDFTGAPGAAEKTKESNEKFQEQYRQQQAANQRAKQQEARKKQDDNVLASVIVQFLHDPAHTQHFILISRLIAKNIPSDLILAVIALIYEPARAIIEEKFAEVFLKLETPEPSNISDNGNVRIDDWVNKIYLVASAEPHHVIETTLDFEQRIDSQLIQFSVIVLREFLEKSRDEEVNFENLKNFCKAFWKKLLEQLKSQVDYQNLLGSKEDDIDSQVSPSQDNNKNDADNDYQRLLDNGGIDS